MKSGVQGQSYLKQQGIIVSMTIPKLKYKGVVKGAPGARKQYPGHEAKENDVVKMKWRQQS